MFEVNSVKNNIKKLFEKIESLKKYFDYDSKKNRLEEIKIKIKQFNTWIEHDNFKDLIRELSSLENLITDLDSFTQNLIEKNNLLELAIEERDYEIFLEIQKELLSLENKVNEFEFHSMFSCINDISNCYMDIQAGSGGTEAQEWASILLRMYLRWAEAHGFKIKIIEELDGSVVGIKSVTIKVIGYYAYGWLRTETGVHRLVRKSPFDSNGKRHTSFSSIFVYPELNKDIDIYINPSDLRIDVYRASGAGGQHVNRTESAVRITHLPTKIVTQCQNNRSQHKNKNQAIKQLKLKLYKFELQKKNIEKKILENSKLDINWGNQIRSYILDDSRIKDLRTGVEIRNTLSVLNGDLDKFIKASLKAGL